MTEEKTFIDKYPSLKGKGFCDVPDMEDSLDEWNKIKIIKSESDVYGYRKYDIEKCCLDKQEVRDVLDGELLLEVKDSETKKDYGLRLINKIKNKLRL